MHEAEDKILASRPGCHRGFTITDTEWSLMLQFNTRV